MSAARDRLSGVHRRAGELLDAGNVTEYAEVLERAAEYRRGRGRFGEAAKMLANEADRWLGEEQLTADEAIPVGLAGDVEELAA
ncbi:hypothetical protein SEA_TINALIN_42 [Gordonia phage TinaLin]|uniref:Uncharacterized protein n=1 Tax=Gordonia phage TinaLin TaxID=2797324 RepID=A0A7T7GTE3_9CAUD|nr:hypothetical protein KDJ60_gp64 [Gordonia phage TinaLin]QQM15130.1 hypothetical protein SEA_TINALIN_42 [Gordonia phage TinaLin]